jgi:predicted nucleic acid-binding protein
MNIFVDSCVFISAFYDKDSFHQESLEFIKKYSQETNCEIIINNLVILESLNVLAKKNIPADGLNILADQVFGHSVCKHVSLSEEILKTSLKHLKTLSLKTSDLSLLLTAYEHADVFVSWDKKLIKKGKNILPCLTPLEFQETESNQL